MEAIGPSAEPFPPPSCSSISSSLGIPRPLAGGCPHGGGAGLLQYFDRYASAARMVSSTVAPGETWAIASAASSSP